MSPRIRGGTSYSAWHDNPTAWPFAGKTGTAQVKDKADTSVFAGWGPAVPGQAPEYAVAVIIPEAGFGSDVAAPLTFDILAPVSRGQIDPVCPALDPQRSECEQAKARAYAQLEAALAPAPGSDQAAGAGDAVGAEQGGAR
ncbi:MAG: penicillin-binding transpeptidase domain-containing protein [Microthrixaceae bacterium]|nr:penicillin-binding transpeptidase domain-containing protein [Microthrixaceae bacterium]